MTGGRKLPRLGTRRSPLALWQARHVAQKLLELGVEVELVPMAASGDLILNLAIRDLPSNAPFTDVLDTALLAGSIEMAVHSLKDLPIELPEPMVIAAVLPRGEVTESLVSFNRLTLAELPAGTTVGTSSLRRQAQLLNLRPDLVPVPLRGPVDERVQQVRRGTLTAAVLATAGLQRLDLLDEAAEQFSLDRFLPAPAQGALAVTVRADDETTREMVARLNDRAASLATQAELELFRPFEASRTWAIAAHARFDVDHERIHLRGRLISADGRIRADASEEGTDPNSTAARVLEALVRQVNAPERLCNVNEVALSPVEWEDR